MSAASPHILILGAGINGCALARELTLNGVSVTLVDQADISYGATAYSSRLIHGGLRYLEYGEFDLVRESLGERTRLLRLAPQFVRPLQLFIPVDNRAGGLFAAAGKFLGWPMFAGNGQASRRGAWLVRMGLWFYDSYARDPSLPKHRSHAASDREIVRVDQEKFRWLLSYYDAQVLYPERFTLALLADARQIARERGLQFDVHTYHRARLHGKQVEIEPVELVGRAGRATTTSIEPDAIVNATGAWVDLTLAALGVRSNKLMGGTKGSHFITFNARLWEKLGGKGIYAEAADGRPVFILPFGDGTLVGTTDEPYAGDPADAVASDEELAYLLETANEIIPQAQLTADDIDLHYSGVRPLPRIDAGTPGAITRRHWMQEISGTDVPCFSIIGGKLTTCRSLAEESTATLLARLGQRVQSNTRDRPLPGAEHYPHDDVDLRARWEQLGMRNHLSEDQLRAMWALCGTMVETVLRESQPFSTESLTGTSLPVDFVRWVICHEWATTLDDLVERRLMLVFGPRLTEGCLRQLAELLVAGGKLGDHQVEQEVMRTVERLVRHFGKRVAVAQEA